MKIKWLGHSSFLLTDSKGRKLLIDPFDSSVGYEVYEGEADIITISHHHFDHDFIKKVKGHPEIIDKVGFFMPRDINIVGLPSYHDKVKGAKRGNNVIFIIEMDGYRICHLGDLGHELSDVDLDKIGHVDVLMIPVGGNYTLDGKEASDVAKSINSHIVLPMHYKTSFTKLPIEGVEDFIINMGNGERMNSSTLDLKDKHIEKLEENNLVKLLDV
jgi:L-ascorbate metabolism protein UlaG (beta-lactamase superfamily)